MNIEDLQKIKTSLEEKDFNVFYYLPDTKNTPLFFVKRAYDFVKTLSQNGYKAHIVHENEKYTKPTWFNTEDVSHVSLNNNEIGFGPDDFIFVPETQIAFINAILQNQISSKYILVADNYEYITDVLTPGATWMDYGITDVVVTNDNMKQFIGNLFKKNFNYYNVPVYVSDTFKPFEGPKKPVVAFHSRNTENFMRVVKQFYISNPNLRWVSFIDMRNMSEETFAQHIRESAVAVWVDDVSSHGTFPLECFKSKTHLIGKIPNMPQEYVKVGTGVWVDNKDKLHEMIGTYMLYFIEDSLPKTVFDENLIEEIVQTYTYDKFQSALLSLMEDQVNKRIQLVLKQIEDSIIVS